MHPIIKTRERLIPMAQLRSIYRSHTCGELRAEHVGETVRLSGWCHRIRDHGGVLFIDLRDHYGMTQCVADPDSPAFKAIESARAEWVVQLEGKVRTRPAGTANAELPTGAVELFVTGMEVLGKADELPLQVFGDQPYPEDTRLKYRFLDLRRDGLHRNIMLRGQVVDALRMSMKGQGFNEFQTPILTASSPEGARDFLVPSRIHPGKFYALPQAPQQYKQLLMMAGFDRYFQIAPCFRDEDPRADRLPGEFYQLDLEMSFVEQEDVFAAVEPVIGGVFREFGGGRPVTPSPWPRIPYAEAMRKYGSDKPDLRNPLIMQEVSEHFREGGFGIFAKILAAGPNNEVWAIPVQHVSSNQVGGTGAVGRAACDRFDSWAKSEGQHGLANVYWAEAETIDVVRARGGDIDCSGLAKGPIAKNLGEAATERLRRSLNLGPGDACFFVAGDPAKFVKFAGLARTKVAEELNLVDKERFELAWIVDFPMFEWNEDEKKVDFSHNPFSMPQGGMEALQTQDPVTIKAFQYDIACNGFELASGGIRNHKPEAMVKAFEIAGYSRQTVEERFGGMFRAFHYGAPPHGGMAAGVDRIVMLLAGAQNLREVALFPMNQQGLDVLMGAPSDVTTRQLRELHIRLNLPEAKASESKG
jgi:aspartyl-tRNA synthetase